MTSPVTSCKHVHSRDNPEYRHWLSLAGDKRARREHGQTVLEGPHLVEAALAGGITPLAWLLSEDSFSGGGFAPLLERAPRAPCLVVPENLFRAVAPSVTPAGLMASIAVPRPGGDVASFALLLEDIQDPGNLGALIRCAAAAGVRAVYLSSGCAEAWSPKCLRGGQGGHFLLDIHEDEDLAIRAAGLPGPVFAAVLGADDGLFELDLRGPCAFALGNEGAGLSAGLRAACVPFTIPMPGRVESLNVAAAAAVCLFERVRQLGQGASGSRSARPG